MKKSVLLITWLILTGWLLVACGSSEENGRATVDPGRLGQAQTAFAQASPTPSPRPTETPIPDVENELAQLAARMARAVRSGDTTAYLAFVDERQPFLLAEQQAWVASWPESGFQSFSIRLSTISLADEQTATARLTMQWQPAADSSISSGGTTLSVRFVRGPDGDWLFGGEAWQVVRVFEAGGEWLAVWPDDPPPPDDATERLNIYYLPTLGAIEGTRQEVTALLETLPGLYGTVVVDLGLEPDNILHVRYHDTALNLQTMASLGLPVTVRHWVVPDLPVRLASQPDTRLPPAEETLLVMVTQALLYDLLDTEAAPREWLAAGAGNLLVGRYLETVTWINNQIEFIINQLPASEAIQPEDSPLLNDPNAAAGHALLLYLDETYGVEARNEWLQQAISMDVTLDAATQAVLDIDFDTLNEDWLRWLADQI